MSWNNVSLGAAILQSEITGSGSDWSKVTTYLNGKCTSESQYYCEASWGSARYNTTMQLAALVTSSIPHRAERIIPAGARHRWQ